MDGASLHGADLSAAKVAERLSDGAGVEVSFPGRHVAMISPRGRTDMGFLRETCQRERDGIISLVNVSGAAVLRGFEVGDARDHESLMTDGFGFSPIYTADYLKRTQAFLKAADRAPRGGGTLLDLPVDPTMQGPHIENGWRSRRPRYVSFWCEVAPLHSGATALFDMSESYERLGTDLRSYFEGYASLYPAYGERLTIDSLLVHPHTSRPCLVMWYFESPLAEHAVAAYKKTLHFRNGRAPAAIAPHTAVNYPLRHLFRRGAEEFSLSEAETNELMDVVYRGAWYLNWRKGDVLILDNISTAHGRMPCESSRRLVAGYWNEEDVRQYAACPGLADDCPSTMAAVRSQDYFKRMISDVASGKFKM
jgi:alpha-ketoglutarate-dependent taurine dioxygenase